MPKHLTNHSSHYLWGVLIAGIIIVATFSLFGSVFYSYVQAAPDSMLSFNPANPSVEVGQTVELDARITPGTNLVNSVELHFTFDQTKLQLDSITPSATFSLVLISASINNTNGTASIALGVPLSDPAITADASMATLSFTSLATVTDSPVTYTGASIAAAEGEGGNVIQSLVPAAVTITAADVTPPTITSVTSSKANGSYTTGEVIPVTVNFSEAVTSTGNVTVTLETGTTDRTCTFTVSNASTGSCNYTVVAGDTTADLTVKTIAGTIADQAANAMTNFVPATNLAASKAIVIDTTAPTVAQVTAVPTPASDTTPNYTFSSTEAGTITYGGDCTSGTVAASSGNNTITFSALSVATHSNCTVRVTDTAGNQSNLLSVTSFTIDLGAPDLTPPIISAVAVSSITQTGATVTWTTDESADSWVEYGTSASYGLSTTLDATPRTSHSQALTGLSANTTYHYRVTSKDADDNTATSSDATFTTLANTSSGGGGGSSSGGGGGSNAVSPVPPPTNVSSIVAPGTVKLAWTNPTHRDFRKVQVVRKVGAYPTSIKDGTNIYEGTSNSFADSKGLQPGVTYYYSLFSIDKRNRASSPAHISAMVITGSNITTKLTWTNPTDFNYLSTFVVRKEASVPTSVQDGAIIYKGTAQTFTDTVPGGTNPKYAIFAINKNGASTALSVSAVAPLGASGGDSREALLIKINSLLKLIAELKAQLAAKQGGNLSPTFVTFTRALTLGMEGEDVRSLQRVLNTRGYPIATVGDGAFGFETTYFGPATLAALRRFQCANLQICSGTPATTGYGQTGPQTRAALSN